MRMILLIVLAVASCGSDDHVANVDQGATSAPPCPPNAAALHGARCMPGVDTRCSCGPDCSAHCQCDGWWETDQVLTLCHGDMSVAD